MSSQIFNFSGGFRRQQQFDGWCTSAWLFSPGIQEHITTARLFYPPISYRMYNVGYSHQVFQRRIPGIQGCITSTFLTRYFLNVHQLDYSITSRFHVQDNWHRLDYSNQVVQEEYKQFYYSHKVFMDVYINLTVLTIKHRMYRM